MEEKVLQLISKITKISIDELMQNTHEEKLWDSLMHIELIITLENEFDITFKEDELAELTSVFRIIDAIERKVA